MEVLEIAVPGGGPSLNSRGHWAVRSRKARAFRDDAYLLARDARNRSPFGGFPWNRVVIHLVFRFPTQRRRDLDNLIGTAKPAIDGLVLAGVIADDSAANVVGLQPSIAVDPRVPRALVLRVERVPDGD
jgi:crossover junction endodeoxyribonuclease RusA